MSSYGLELLDELLEVEEGLSDSAVQFIEGLAKKRDGMLPGAFELTSNQVRALESVQAELEARERAGES